MPSSKNQLSDVFPLSGVPRINFVAPVEFSRLKVALSTKGRGVVVEGPSGIGKTTSINRALEELAMDKAVISLSARKKDDRDFIQELPRFKEAGVVIIDDFHRLDESLSLEIADYLKVLADEGDETTKLIIIGINKAGESLISFGRDLATRLEVIRFEREPDERVEQLIDLGSAGLNVQLDVKDEIIGAANGSFFLAQLLCHETCISADITETSDTLAIPHQSFEHVNGRVVDRLAEEFDRIAVSFASGGKLRREGRAPYLHILRWLSEANEWSIDIEREMAKRPKLKGSVGQVINKGYLSALLEKDDKGIRDVLHYEPTTQVISVEDPKFYYYIRNLSWTKFAQRVGYLNIQFSTTHDFALSFAGEDRKLAKAIFDDLSAREFSVFYDHNEQARILAESVEEYLDPIYRSESTYVVCLLSAYYPTRIWTKFESEAFKTRFGANDVIPIQFEGMQLSFFDTSTTVGFLAFDPTKEFEPQVTRICETLAERVRERVLSTTATED